MNKMQEAQLRNQLTESRAEVQRLKEIRIKLNVVAVSAEEIELGKKIHRMANELTVLSVGHLQKIN